MMTNKQLTARWRHFEPSENQKSSDCLTKGLSPEDVARRLLRHSGPTSAWRILCASFEEPGTGMDSTAIVLSNSFVKQLQALDLAARTLRPARGRRYTYGRQLSS